MPITKQTVAAMRQHEQYLQQMAIVMAKDELHGKLVLEYPGAPTAFRVINRQGYQPTIQEIAVTYLETSKP